jgi:hypothetical protein
MLWFVVYLAGRANPSDLRVSPLPFSDAAALGLIPGAAIIEKSGRNPDVDATAAEEDVWNGGGIYTGFPDGAAEALRITSASAADTAAGTGARTVRIVGLGPDGVSQIEVFTLAGTADVVTASTWTRVNRAYVQTAGSGGVNAGDITIRHNVTTANVFAVLPAGFGQTQVASYSIPAGWRGILQHVRASCSNAQQTAQEVTVKVLTRTAGTGAWRTRRLLTISTTSSLDEALAGGIRLDSRDDIVLRAANATADNLLVTAGFEILLLDV